MTDIVTRLRNLPFGTETSERNLMAAAADEIERLREALREIDAGIYNDNGAVTSIGPLAIRKIAQKALQPVT